MIDDITLNRIKLLHPTIREQVKDLYVNRISPALTSDWYCRFAYTYRSFEEQAELYAQGRTKLFDKDGKRLGIVTKAKPGTSMHNYGLAIDIVLVNGKSPSWDIVKDFDKDGKSDWMEVIDIFKTAGWLWGGDWKFKDYPHVELPQKFSVKEILEKYQKGDTFIDPITSIKYVNI